MYFFMLHERHYYNPHFTILDVKRRAKEPEKVYDKLFYTVYHKQSWSDKYNETLEKIHVIEKLEPFKMKHKDKILEDLQSPCIPLHCLPALCEVWCMNIVWYAEHCYYECFVDESKPIYYLSHTYQWTDTMDANKFKITDLFKPLKSISYYKLEDLKQMTQYMNLDGKKKSDFYESVQDYFKHLKLI